jgi:hypothetical protein
MINIRFVQLIFDGTLHVDDPIRRLPAVTALTSLEDLFLCDIGNTNVVVLAPLLLEAVVDESKVMAGLGATLMHSDRVQVIGLLLHIADTERGSDLLLLLGYLGLHSRHLLRELVLVLREELDGLESILLVAGHDLLFERMLAIAFRVYRFSL